MVLSKYGIIFPGQGSQYVGMGKTVCEQYPIADNIFNEANEILGMDIKNICFNGKAGILNRIEHALPAIFITSVAVYRAFEQEYAASPSAVAGHSLGEYAALTVSGVLSFNDALKLVKTRSDLAIGVREGTMSIIDNYDVAKVKDLLKEREKELNAGEFVMVACDNAEDQCVICGSQQAVSEIENILAGKGVTITPMIFSPPFHSPYMESVSAILRQELDKVDKSNFGFPVYSNVLGAKYPHLEDIPDLLARQVAEPVLWRQTVESMFSDGIHTLIEVGPQTILMDLLRRSHISRYKTLLSFTHRHENLTLSDFFSVNARQKRRNYDITIVTKCLAAAVSTKNMNWDNEEYTKGVIEPYAKIKSIQMKLQQERESPTEDECIKAVMMLKSVLVTKKVPQEKWSLIWDYVFEGEDLSIRERLGI